MVLDRWNNLTTKEKNMQRCMGEWKTHFALFLAKGGHYPV